MPLLDEKTEFARKWMELCRAQQEEGIREPVQAFEFMNRFYVQEGNKRVSVLKYFGAASIRARVTRILPKHTGTPENRVYFEFLDFYQATELNTVWFSRPGSYARLTAAAGRRPRRSVAAGRPHYACLAAAALFAGLCRVRRGTACGYAVRRASGVHRRLRLSDGLRHDAL